MVAKKLTTTKIDVADKEEFKRLSKISGHKTIFHQREANAFYFKTFGPAYEMEAKRKPLVGQ